MHWGVDDDLTIVKIDIDADELDHVRNPIAAMNEAWVATFADADPADIVARFRELTSARLAALAAIFAAAGLVTGWSSTSTTTSPSSRCSRAPTVSGFVTARSRSRARPWRSR